MKQYSNCSNSWKRNYNCNKVFKKFSSKMSRYTGHIKN